METKITQIKIFDDRFSHDLCRRVNEWIEENNIDVVDVKFQVVHDRMYSAMVIYKK